MLETFNFRIIWQYRELFVGGLWATTWMSAIGLIGALLAGILACTARLSGFKLISAPAIAYIELIRSTPLLAQLYFFYFGLPSLGIYLTEIQTGILALSLNSGAYIAEIVRSGVKAVSYGQIEAATASGLTLPQRLLCIILPQALGYTIPPLLGQAIVLVKDSALLSLISAFELTRAGQTLVSERFTPAEGFFTVALLYLLLYYGLKALSSYSHQHLTLYRREG
ncbi:ABC-type amino acid transporter, permease component [Candidatus Vecturithrix granuli]|uniref:ABC-type amino acid transporter, permease component n=1 Tax=Vecturithrix granuli TaxID=1499967 RepID=A0A0S6W9N9_VECG1|nr:ABC-type amino acid transporter, permease component [Candidatus Vecturithrix granuli]